MYALHNEQLGSCGEVLASMVYNALKYPHFLGLEIDSKHGDIDVLDLKNGTIIEVKNWSSHYPITTNMFYKQILDRFVKADPIARWYLRQVGIHGNPKYNLIIPKAPEHIKHLCKQFGVNVIETKVQALPGNLNKAFFKWYSAIKRFFRPVYLGLNKSNVTVKFNVSVYRLSMVYSTISTFNFTGFIHIFLSALFSLRFSDVFRRIRFRFSDVFNCFERIRCRILNRFLRPFFEELKLIKEVMFC